MRIILSKEELKGSNVTVSGEKAKYLISVLRCNLGDELQVFDGEGSCYRAKISDMGNKKITIDLLEKVPYDTESPLNLVLVQGILKGEKMDLVIQKTTELGVREIIPAITERSQIRETRKTARWRKIAEEASRQSGRTKMPTVHEPMELSAILEADRSGDTEKRRHGEMKGFIFWEEGGMPLGEAVQRIKMQDTDTSPLNSKGHGGVNSQLSTFKSQLFIAIGPEGGFTKEEVSLANTKGLITVSLGKRILRAETAAISAVALVQFLMGDMN